MADRAELAAIRDQWGAHGSGDRARVPRVGRHGTRGIEQGIGGAGEGRRTLRVCDRVSRSDESTSWFTQFSREGRVDPKLKLNYGQSG